MSLSPKEIRAYDRSESRDMKRVAKRQAKETAARTRAYDRSESQDMSLGTVMKKTNSKRIDPKLTVEDLLYLNHLLDHGIDSLCSSGVITGEQSFSIQSKIKAALRKGGCERLFI
jgi:hypothetical protein